MRFAIFGADVATGVDENLAVINARTIAIRNADDDCKRKLLCRFLKLRHCALTPGCCVFLDHRHRIAGIDHFRKTISSASESLAREAKSLTVRRFASRSPGVQPIWAAAIFIASICRAFL